MEFHEQLSEYMERAQITVSALSEASGLSASVISRYKSGKRVPAIGSMQLERLAEGLEQLMACSGTEISGVLQTLSATLEDASYDAELFAGRLDELLNALGIRNAELAKKLRYDPSYISKIRSGMRRPSDMGDFLSRLGTYLLSYCREAELLCRISDVLGCTQEEAASFDHLYAALSEYLYNGVPKPQTETHDLLKALDVFDLEDYIRTIHFDELKVPSVPFALPKSQNYYGVEGMREAELVFAKATVLSGAKEPVFMCSDMSMEMLVDNEFPKKWMLGLALMLKKGLQIRMIHYLNRPFHELMLGLEAWIPLYMTGQVSPYYLSQANDNVYRHILYTSGAAALSGESIAGADESGRKYVTNNKREMAYYRKRAKDLLAKAHPLMEIYRREHRRRFESFLAKMRAHMASRHNRLSALSLGVLPEDILAAILDEAEVAGARRKDIMEYAAAERKSYLAVLAEHEITEIVPLPDEEAYAKTPHCLPLAALFEETPVVCSYARYCEYMEAARTFAREHAGYHLIETAHPDFTNIQIQTVVGEYVLVSKTKAPTIHFVIRHPTLVDAIENMVVPIRE